MLGSWGDERPRRDRTGTVWHFAYWHSSASCGQHLAFWNDAKTECGVMSFQPDKAIAYTRIVDQIKNLTAKAELRKRHLFALKFPLQEHHSRYGDFPAEQEYLQRKEAFGKANGGNL